MHKIIHKQLSKFILVLLLANCKTALAQVPHLTGEVNISILNGTIEGNLEYSNLPQLANYSIWLNAGLNVAYFRDGENKFNYATIKYYDDDKSYEAFQYYFSEGKNKKRSLPEKFKISYVGKFAAINDTTKVNNHGDWKGNIAFNGQSIRASEQTAWYPVIYDVENDVSIDKVTYNVKINCADCKSIYLNGSAPITGSAGNFKSDQPISLLLFAGIFDFNKSKNTYFVNTDLSSAQENILGTWTDKIVSFYEHKLKIHYGHPVTYLYAKPISKKNAWMFVTYPTIAIIGHEKYNVKSYFLPNSNTLRDSSTIAYFAHELGHYYFGTVIVPNSDLRWVFLEGLTEYVALQTVKEILGGERYQRKIDGYFKNMKDYVPQPLSTIKNHEVDETYRYVYVPLLITALEKEIGKEKVWNWLRTILTTEELKRTDYQFFKSSLIKSGVTEGEFKRFEEKYIISETGKESIYKIVSQ